MASRDSRENARPLPLCDVCIMNVPKKGSVPAWVLARRPKRTGLRCSRDLLNRRRFHEPDGVGDFLRCEQAECVVEV